MPGSRAESHCLVGAESTVWGRQLRNAARQNLSTSLLHPLHVDAERGAGSLSPASSLTLTCDLGVERAAVPCLLHPQQTPDPRHHLTNNMLIGSHRFEVV